MPNWLGDNIMCIPAVNSLKKECPELKLKAFCPSPIASIWKMTGLMDELYTYENSMHALGVSIYMPLKNDVAIVYPNSFSSALSAFLTRSKMKIGYAGNCRNFLITYPIKRSEKLHQVDEYYHLLFEEKSEKELIPYLQIDKAPEEIMSLVGLKSFQHGKDRLIAVAPGAAWSKSKKWPKEYYALVMSELLKEGYYIILAGFSEELTNLIEHQNERVKFLTGPLEKIASVFSLCFAAIGNDSGLMHLSAATGCRSIIIYGATDWRKTYPRSSNCHVLSSEVPCQPCWQKICPRKDYQCLNSIAPWHIVTLIKNLT